MRGQHDLYGNVNRIPPQAANKPAGGVNIRQRPSSAHPSTQQQKQQQHFQRYQPQQQQQQQLQKQQQKQQQQPIRNNIAFPGARNKQEQDYLRQLEAIRYQNFIERRAVHQNKVSKNNNNNNNND
eukprot:UN26987